MLIDLSSLRVVVTGASRGVGGAVARAFAAEGCSLAVCARGEQALREQVDCLVALGARSVLGRPCDVRDSKATRDFVDEAAAVMGGIDILVNNAGQGGSGTVDSLTAEELMAHGDLIQGSHLRMAQAVVPHMRAAGGGRIVNINAVAGKFPQPNGLPSSVNRAAAMALSDALASGLAPDGILVNSVNLGFVDTGQWERHRERQAPHATVEQVQQAYATAIPLGRLASPEDVAGVVLFLAGPLASYVTRASIDVTGGLGVARMFPAEALAELRAKTEATPAE